jgi:hypothetical protein
VNKIVFWIDSPARALPMLLAPLLLMFTAASGRADMLSFSYTDTSNNVIAGTIDGVLQPDHNTFLVTGVGPVTFDGNPTPMLNFIDSLDDINGNGGGFLGDGTPAVALDGTYMDLIACTDNSCADGFAFAVGNASAIANGSSGFVAGASFAGQPLRPSANGVLQWSPRNRHLLR